MGARSNEWHRSCFADNLRQILMQINPHRKEIVSLISILNRMGANFKLIAACLNLKRWKNYYGYGGWTEEDVKIILGVLRS